MPSSYAGIAIASLLSASPSVIAASSEIAATVRQSTTSVTANRMDKIKDEIKSRHLASKNPRNKRPEAGGSPEIVGGEPIEPYSRPYLVSLTWMGYHICGGTMITPSVVLSAAHCHLYFGQWDPITAVDIHRHDLYDDAQVIRMYPALKQRGGDIYMHPDYDDYTLENDLSLIFLPSPIEGITTVTLNEDPNMPMTAGDSLDATGWGATSYDGFGSDVPLAVSVPYVPNDQCAEPDTGYPQDWIYDSMLCAGIEGKGVCFGDSGGPLVVEDTVGGPDESPVQVGITSWGIGCADEGYPAVYTRISSHIEWIKSTVCERTGEMCDDAVAPPGGGGGGSKSGKSTKSMANHSQHAAATKSNRGQSTAIERAGSNPKVPPRKEDESICGPNDDRKRSNDIRIGRMWPMGCTAFLISEDIFVTSGNCVDEEIQDAYPEGFYVEFNVPLSTPDGDVVPSDPEDQYLVRYDSESELFPVRGVDFDDSDLGYSWSVGRLMPNEITGMKAGEKQGCWYNLEYEDFVAGDSIGISGYGLRYDNKQQLNLAQQTHVASVLYFYGEYGTAYDVDTTGGQSGSPLINPENDRCYGVHNYGGCDVYGDNVGSSNNNPSYKSAVEYYLGIDDAANDQNQSPMCPEVPSFAPTEPMPTESPTEYYYSTPNPTPYYYYTPFPTYGYYTPSPTPDPTDPHTDAPTPGLVDHPTMSPTYLYSSKSGKGGKVGKSGKTGKSAKSMMSDSDDHKMPNSMEVNTDPSTATEAKKAPSLAMKKAASQPIVPLTKIDETICGPDDDRKRSNDLRQGRMLPMGCTAWLISDDVFVAAGHCVDEDIQDDYPNGFYVEFNVPLSTPDGDIVHSDPEDQYLVRYESGLFPVRGVDFDEGSLGYDWTVGRLMPNEITGMKAGEKQGCWYNLEYENLMVGDHVRITGYGGNPVNKPELFLVQKTHVAAFLWQEEYVIGYEVDTTGGNSGSPILNSENDRSYGIHTNGGCDIYGDNLGVSNNNPDYKAAVERYLGIDDAATDQDQSPMCPEVPSFAPTEPMPTEFPTPYYYSTPYPTPDYFSTPEPTKHPVDKPTVSPTKSNGIIGSLSFDYSSKSGKGAKVGKTGKSMSMPSFGKSGKAMMTDDGAMYDDDYALMHGRRLYGAKVSEGV